jgi:hypothetical protein
MNERIQESDRTLLELAAKAAGLDTPRYVIDGFALGWTLPNGISTESGLTSQRLWNPLIDDADAFRLAVKLGLKVSSYVYFSDECQLSATATAAMPSDSSWIDQPIGRFPEYTESHVKHDPCAATRRAIVRAAAEIGRDMK